ncbi:MAG: peptide deformylase [Bacteroidetes bacterium]|nr:peptide deformylase [Bacteroidota bacterium]MDA0874192.1 peptide deformylase [Bacteroidota bacterium]
MVLPIYLLGTDELRVETSDVKEDSAELQKLIDDMIETMHAAKGIGLAAPQVGRLERLFVVDVSPMEEDFEESGVPMPDQPMVFINADIVAESEEDSEFEEGCLSIPDVHEVVERPEALRIRYLDREFNQREEEYDGILARVIQHEYDHVDGVLFIDHLTAFKRRLLKRRLQDIREGRADASYPVLAKDLGVIEPEE